MAIDSRKTTAKDKDSEDTKQSGGSTEMSVISNGKSAPGFLIPMVTVAIVISLAGVGVGGYILFTQMQPASAEEGGEGGEATGEITETDIYFNGFQTGIVNLTVSDENPFMYLKYNFEVEVDSEEVVEEIATKLPRLTSKVAGVMSNRDWNEISSAEGRERLARECMRAINDELTTGECIGLYFTTFVAQ